MMDDELRLSCLKTELTLYQLLEKAQKKEDAMVMSKVITDDSNNGNSAVNQVRHQNRQRPDTQWKWDRPDRQISRPQAPREDW